MTQADAVAQIGTPVGMWMSRPESVVMSAEPVP